MSFKLIVDTFSVARDSDHFIQLKTLKKPRTDDQVWVAIEIVGDSKYARATTQSIIDTIDEVFFDNYELSPYERFEQALKEVNIIAKSMKEKRKKSSGKINAIIAVFSGQELHITQSNTAEAYLLRQNKFSMISEGLSSRSDDLFVNIASGEIMSDDKLIFTTARLLRLATHSQLVQLFNDGVAEAVESIRELTMGNDDLSLGVICMHTKLMTKPGNTLEQVRAHPIWNKVKKVAQMVAGFVVEKSPQRLKGVGKGANGKKVLVALATVVLLLVVSVSVLMESSRQKAVRAEYSAQLERMTEDLHVANTKGYANDKETANAILDKVEDEARLILDTNFFRTETMALLDKAQEARDNINNTDRLKQLAPYIDLSTKRESPKALSLVSLDDKFFVFEYNTLYEVILDQVLDPRQIDDTEVVIAGTAMEDQDAIVFLTQSGRVMEFVNGLFRFANTEDQVWKSGVDVAAFGRYIYMLSPEDNQIYKYARLRSDYSNGSEYNGDADLSDAISLTIDGNIYVLKTGGRIVKIFKSKQQPFKIENLAVDISDATQIYTAPELDNLYILDPVNKRVVIVEKASSGNNRYYGQVVFEDLENIKRIYVERSEDKLHVLTDSEIYRIDI